MIVPMIWELAAGLFTGLATGVAANPVLRRLREPADTDDKLPYAGLATRSFAVGCGLVATAGALLATLTIPAPQLPPWLVLASIGVLLAGIDLRTTWLPRRLTHFGWVLAVAAVGIGAILGGGLAFAARSLGGAAIAAALYAAVWALSRGGFGFGDVRYAPLVGVAAAGLGWSTLLLALTAGAMIGALHGLTRRLLRRFGAFPYAPALLAGGFAALLLAQFTPST